MRHDEARRFVSIEKVPSADQDVSPLAARIAGCIVTDSEEATRLLEFANGEAMLNARQHSGGEGFVAAQFTPSNETARIGVSDCGIGIRESFRRNESPHFRAEMSDLDILLKALEPEISSTTHKRTLYGRSPNRGVGLSMMRNLMSQTLGGMALISGSAWWNQTASNPPTFGEFPDGVYFNGTICALAFRRDQITSHFKMLEQARIKLGLQTDGSLDSMFT